MTALGAFLRHYNLVLTYLSKSLLNALSLTVVVLVHLKLYLRTYSLTIRFYYRKPKRVLLWI